MHKTGFMRMAGNLLRNSLNATKKRRDGMSAGAPLAGKGRRMGLSARLILLLTIAVGVVMASGGYLILRQREEILARACGTSCTRMPSRCSSHWKTVIAPDVLATPSG